MEKNRLRPENLVWKLALWDHIYTVNATLLFFILFYFFFCAIDDFSSFLSTQFLFFFSDQTYI